MPAPVSRRALVRGAVAGGASAVVGGTSLAAARAMAAGPHDPTLDPVLDLLRGPLIFHSPRVQPFVDPLPTLPVSTGPDHVVEARSTRHRFHSAWDESSAFGYGGSTYLGPVLENHAGVESSLTFRNRLGLHPFAKDLDLSLHGVSAGDRTAPRSVVHMHGGVTPPVSDGHPETMISPGEDFTHHFPNRQDAAALWYHDHAMGMTRLNVYAGLASMYLLRDDWDTGRADNPLGLPSGRYEVPLVLQEKIFTRGGVQSVRSTPIVPEGRWEGGAVGDVGVVNGAVWPELEVDRGLYRLRVVNAGSFSVWNLFLDDRRPFWVIGTDLGLLDAPVRTTSLRLAPAERVDLLVDFGDLRSGETITLCNDEEPPGQAAIIGEVTMPFFLRFRASARRGFRGPVPRTLRGGRRQPPRLPPVPRPDRVRNVTIAQPLDLRIPPSIMTLNNQRFTSTDIELPRQGTVEQWNLVNVTPDPHPIHVHLVKQRIVGRQPFDPHALQRVHPMGPVGRKWTPSADRWTTGPMVGPAPWEAGLKDTVRADGNTITRVVMRFPTADELGFDPDAPFVPTTAHLDGHHQTGRRREPIRGYVWHCHILDHEDHDMMLKFRTVAP